MNKNDFKLIVTLILIIFLFFIRFNIFERNDSKKAFVYYEDKVVLVINLDEDKIYQVDGYNGKVEIEVSSGKIKVKNENSPLHLCSNQGYIDSIYETIICLPNKIVIKIESDYDYIDTIVK